LFAVFTALYKFNQKPVRSDFGVPKNVTIVKLPNDSEWP